MTLKHLAYLSISMTVMFGPLLAEAQMRQHGGGYPSRGQGPLPLPDDTPTPGGPNYPQPPQNPQQPPQYPGDGGYNNPGNNDQKTVYLNRRVINERLPIMALAGIDRRYEGYTVESVTVNLMGADVRTQMALFINGRPDSWVNSPQGFVRFVPRYQAVLGRGVNSVELDVRGLADISTIVICLRAPNNGGGNYPNPGGQIVLPLGVARRLLGNDRLDITPYVNLYQYRGYKIKAVGFEAASLMGVALVDLAINNVFQFPRVQVGNWIQQYMIYPQNAVIGQNADNIVFFTQGNLDIRGVTLYLENCGQQPMPPQPPQPPQPQPPRPPRPR